MGNFTENEPVPICPNCGSTEKEWYRNSKLEYDGDEDIFECENCKKRYHVMINIQITFDTRINK